MVILAYSFATVVQIILLVWKGTDCESIPGIEHVLEWVLRAQYCSRDLV